MGELTQYGGKRNAARLVERIASIVFFVCGISAVAAVVAITLYMFISGTPALFQVGILEMLFGTKWAPTAADPSYGILYIILTSLVGTLSAIVIGVPISVLTAVFIAKIAPKPLAKVTRPAVELLAGIPSVIYGLLGLLILNPLMYKLEIMIFRNTTGHRYTGGANLLSAIIILAVMILPTVVNVSLSAIEAVPENLLMASNGLGASKIQTIFKTVLPAARSGILSGVVLGVGRAMGEAMAISLASGNVVNIPLPFNSVRFLTTAIVSEMSYAEVGSTHRNALFTIGLILFIFIMLINGLLNRIIKKGGGEND